MEFKRGIGHTVARTKKTEGKDEMNLAEFPLCSLAHRLNPEVKTLHFEDRIWDKARSKSITRQLTITGSDLFGLPTEKDDEVLLGLIQITRQHGFTDRKVPFTRHELIRTLGWRDDSKSYARVEASLNRWTGVTLYYNKAWWNKERGCWMDEKFHILDNVWLCHRGEPVPDTGLPGAGAPVSAFVWNEVVFRSFTHGNLKSIDFEFFKSLKSAVAKRLYRFLDKRFWHKNELEFDLRELCCEHVGLSRNYDTANLKRKLLVGVRELEERGFCSTCEVNQRFKKIRAGEWRIFFERAQDETNLWNEEAARNAKHQLRCRGIGPEMAKRLSDQFGPEAISKQVKSFDCLIENKGGEKIRSGSGFLVRAIERDYQLVQPPLMRATAVETLPSRVSIAPVNLSTRTEPETKTQTMIRRFWNSLSDTEKSEAEVEAFAAAKAFDKILMQGEGKLAAAARKNALDNYALKKIHQRQ